VSVLRVRLCRGPVNGEVIELDSPLEELTVEVRRSVGFRLCESFGGSEPVESKHVRRTGELHRYRLVQRDPPVMEWVGRMER
jgi:hypothetical protein